MASEETSQPRPGTPANDAEPAVKPEVRQAIVFFVDLVGSSSVSSEHDIKSFWNNYVRYFYASIEQAKSHYCRAMDFKYIGDHLPEEKQVGRIRYRGDELVGFLLFPDDAPTSENVIPDALQEVVRFLYALKLFWLGSPYNLRRIAEGQRPRDISAGIHIGRVAIVSDPKNQAEEYEIGFAINLAKRVEGASRRGESSHIYATGEVYSVFNKWKRTRTGPRELIDGVEFEPPKLGSADHFKGIDPPPDVCELNHSADAPGLFERIGRGEDATIVNHLTSGIGATLKEVHTVRWLDPATDSLKMEELDILADRLYSYSSLWVRADATLLLVACEHAGARRAAAKLCEELKLALSD